MLIVVHFYNSEMIIVDQIQNLDHNEIVDRLAAYTEYDFPEAHVEEDQDYEFYDLDDIESAGGDWDTVREEIEAAGYFTITDRAVTIEGNTIE